MTHIVNTPIENATKMSSREIAELTEKRHDHVLRDIEKMLLDINDPNFGAVDFEAQYQDAKGQWRKEYLLPKDLTITLVTGYRADFRYKVVKRLESLEVEKSTGGFMIPQDYPSALMLAAKQAEQLAVAQPKADALDRISKADGSLCITDAAKTLQIHPNNRLFSYMREHKWIYKRAGNSHYVAYQDKIMVGLLEHKTTTVIRDDGTEKITQQVRVTPKGLARLAEVFETEFLTE